MNELRKEIEKIIDPDTYYGSLWKEKLDLIENLIKRREVSARIEILEQVKTLEHER